MDVERNLIDKLDVYKQLWHLGRDVVRLHGDVPDLAVRVNRYQDQRYGPTEHHLA